MNSLAWLVCPLSSHPPNMYMCPFREQLQDPDIEGGTSPVIWKTSLKKKTNRQVLQCKESRVTMRCYYSLLWPQTGIFQPIIDYLSILTIDLVLSHTPKFHHWVGKLHHHQLSVENKRVEIHLYYNDTVIIWNKIKPFQWYNQ